MSTSLIGCSGSSAFRPIRHCSVDVSRGLVLLSGIGTQADLEAAWIGLVAEPACLPERIARQTFRVFGAMLALAAVVFTKGEIFDTANCSHAHQDINDVMLATALTPNTFLSVDERMLLNAS
jgi:hypothetical protein